MLMAFRYFSCLVLGNDARFSFFLYFQPGLDLEAHLQRKQESVRKMGLTLQPHVVVLCEDMEKLGSVGGDVVYAVIQSNLYFQVPTVMSAIDICIKSCFVLNLAYSHGAKSSWLFLQRAVYDINTAHDENTSRVLQLLAECTAL
jgi:hypothetical protein